MDLEARARFQAFGAGYALICLDEDDDSLTLEISDPGRGIDVEEARRGNGLGLVSAEERINCCKAPRGQIKTRSRHHTSRTNPSRKVSMNRPKVLLADDHTMFVQGLQRFLEDEFELVGTVADGQSLVETARRLDPDVIVVDISMPVLNGFEAVRQLINEGTPAKIIFLTMHTDEQFMAEAFRCGGSGKS